MTDLRNLPSVDKLLSDQRIQRLAESYDREMVVELVRAQLNEARRVALAGGPLPSLADLVDQLSARAAFLWREAPRAVINATGVVLHTNLGRAPLSQEAVEAVVRASRGYVDLELNLEDGKRSSRQVHVEELLCQLTGAEAALVVNNNAAAVLLALTALAQGREVIVSRGEAVEIGGGFRIPDVMRQSGATLVEVGTTNRTYVQDFESAITENTAVLLRVHTSNFRVTGFTHEPSLEEMVELGRRRSISVLHDLGSGCLLDTARFGLVHEPMPQESIAAGMDLALFSGDKLLGGPQAGIVVGKRELVKAISSHPLARAVRIDKLSLAALRTTLLHYLKNEAMERIPVWRMLALSPAELEARAKEWQKAIGSPADVVQGESAIGGGSLPAETLPTWLLAIDAAQMPGEAEALSHRLRHGSPPVLGRVEGERVLLDPRTVLPGEDEALVIAVQQAVG